MSSKKRVYFSFKISFHHKWNYKRLNKVYSMIVNDKYNIDIIILNFKCGSFNERWPVHSQRFVKIWTELNY